MKVVGRKYHSIGISEEQLNGGVDWVRKHTGTDIVDTPLWVLISLGYDAIRKESEDNKE